MAEGIAFAVIGSLAEYTVDPIMRQFSYIFRYKSNINNLRKQNAGLEKINAGIQLQVDAAKRNLEIIGLDTQSWLDRVDQVKTDALQTLERVSQNENKWCPNLKQRYALSRKARKLTKEIRKLKDKGDKYAKIAYPTLPAGILPITNYDSKGAEELEYNGNNYAHYPQPTLPTWIAPTFSTGEFGGFQSRFLILKDIMEALMDDCVSMIGICGMGGVGKTTMANEVFRLAAAQCLFDEFAMTTVSQNQDLYKIQNDLADMLGLKYDEGVGDLTRSQRLLTRLTNGCRVLVVLDDVWDGIHLQKVGIPLKRNCGSCKVICISRLEQVCKEMGADKIFNVQILPDEESWRLFKEMAGNHVENGDLKDIAVQIVKECGGLPIAITTLGKALRNRKKHVWLDALHQLKKSIVTNIQGMRKNVYSCIELSYNFLESSQAKALLTLCCIYQEDANIRKEALVRFAFELQWFDDTENFQETRARVYSVLEDLMSANLLVSGEYEMTVKVHDIVRDVCLSITGLNKWAQKNEKKSQPIISFSEYSVGSEFTSSRQSEGLPSRDATIEKVVNALEDDRVKVIGICGMPGVGKTWTVREACERARERSLFDEVVWLTVPVWLTAPGASKMDILINRFGQKLGLTFAKGTNIVARVENIRLKLVTNNRKILIILDDIWARIELGDLGIPITDPQSCCKVVVVSQMEHLCSEMGTDKNIIVGLLTEEESWDFVTNIVGCRAKQRMLNYLKPILHTICGGLPYAIETFVLEEKKVLTSFRMGGHVLHLMYEKLRLLASKLKRMERGYNLLRRHNPQAHLFLSLCCVLLQESTSIHIEKLVICALRLRVFKDVDELGEMRQRVYSLVCELRSSFWVLPVDGELNVKMHPLVRDVGINVINRDAAGHRERRKLRAPSPDKSNSQPSFETRHSI